MLRVEDGVASCRDPTHERTFGIDGGRDDSTPTYCSASLLGGFPCIVRSLLIQKAGAASDFTMMHIYQVQCARGARYNGAFILFQQRQQRWSGRPGRGLFMVQPKRPTC